MSLPCFECEPLSNRDRSRSFYPGSEDASDHPLATSLRAERTPISAHVYLHTRATFTWLTFLDCRRSGRPPSNQREGEVHHAGRLQFEVVRGCESSEASWCGFVPYAMGRGNRGRDGEGWNHWSGCGVQEEEDRAATLQEAEGGEVHVVLSVELQSCLEM